MKTLYYLVAIVSLFLLYGCWGIQTGKPLNNIAPGEWRGVFMLDEQHKDRVPLVFQVLTNDSNKTVGLAFKNGSQVIQSDSLRFWGDTLFVYFRQQQTYMKLIYEVNLMEGWLYTSNEAEYPLEFQAQSGRFPRFPDVRRTPIHDINGQWSVLMEGAADSLQTVVLDINTKGNYAEANLKMNDGQSFVLEGSIQGDQIYMSGFDGKNVLMLSALATNPKSLQKGHLSINYEKRLFMATK